MNLRHDNSEFARPENPIVFDEYANLDAEWTGKYVVKPPDLPLYGVLCGSTLCDVCWRSLEAGEGIGKIGRN